MQTCKKCFREIGEYPFCPYCGASQGSNLLTLEQIYSEWSTLYFRKVGRKSREGYENAWTDAPLFGQYAIVGYQDQRLSTGYGYSAKQKASLSRTSYCC